MFRKLKYIVGANGALAIGAVMFGGIFKDACVGVLFAEATVSMGKRALNFR